MANIVDGKSSLSKGLEGKVEESKVMPEVSNVVNDSFFNWQVVRGYVPDPVLKSSAFGENIFGYLAQRNIYYRDQDFFQKSVAVLETRALELIGEEKFKEYKKELKHTDDLTRQFRVLRDVFENYADPSFALMLDQVIWGSMDRCLKDNRHIQSVNSSTIDYHLSISDSMTFFGVAAMACLACAPDSD